MNMTVVEHNLSVRKQLQLRRAAQTTSVKHYVNGIYGPGTFDGHFIDRVFERVSGDDRQKLFVELDSLFKSGMALALMGGKDSLNMVINGYEVVFKTFHNGTQVKVKTVFKAQAHRIERINKELN